MMAARRAYDGTVIRVQAQLTEEQATRLRRLSAQRQVSLAALLREGADRILAEAEAPDDRWGRAWEAIGRARGSGASDISEDHDRHLADVFGE